MIVLIYLALLVIAGVLAKEKKRSIILWVFISLFLPVISVVILAVLPEERK